jgi:D-3-phosphoglycerate dehydrogenase / 2-oxoglutarate reductase
MSAATASPTVFVGGDHVLNEVLDSVANQLETEGIRTVRGSAAPPPQRTEYGPDAWPELFGTARVAVVSSRTSITPELMAWAPHLSGVVFASSSTASCDLAAATSAGVLVSSGATWANMASMAEATVMLASALMLDLPSKQRQLADGLPRPPFSELTARMLAGSTFGLVGYGRIAREVVARLRGWDVGEILAYTRSPDANRAPDVRFVRLDDLLAASDVVSLHLPLNASTRGVIGARELDLMRRDAVLINTSRGGLVDEMALFDALAGGRLRGAAIDTFEVEPPSAAHPLRGLPNVILTEHIVGHTRDMFDSLAGAAVDGVRAMLAGQVPINVANPDVLPRWRGMR